MTKWYGFRRPDGQVGCRNYTLILSATIYANSTVERVANTIYGAIPITHHLGRCQTKSDLKMTFDVLCGLAKNPNVGGEESLTISGKSYVTLTIWPMRFQKQGN